VTIGTDKSTSWSSSWSGVAYNSSNGTFQAVAQDFGAIPTVTGAGCPTGGAFVGDYINSTLNLGSNVSAALQYAGGDSGQPTFNPVLHGS
jgi:hypothetical protein